jgi:pimeloyl-ACP methyl ester carboxylesterase
MEYALRYPQNLSHLLLVDTGGDNRWAQEKAPELLAQRGFDMRMVNLARRLLNGQIAPNEMFPALMKLGKAYSPHFSPLKIPHMLIMGLQMKLRPEALIYSENHFLKGWTVMDHLGEIKVPTLVMAGREDFIYPPEHQEALAAGIPTARLVIIDRAGHNVHDEQTAKVLEAVRNFMSTAIPSV